eukprot:CAMPEP_0178425668 /NCGR_PEP_ID=MMETSP0689_2-20121128/28840_1 /TAXON_ID=160604 /ORGANISM="Amphidinium massartii, Strain CS-259" /LENGTH=517 /DNA_ID=CAMNT_0020047335 /DNA_START=108 /DNA_END=1658 /DNA_ORIENTATION=+
MGIRGPVAESNEDTPNDKPCAGVEAHPEPDDDGLAEREETYDEICVMVDDEVPRPTQDSVRETEARHLNVEHLSPVQTGQYFDMLHSKGSVPSGAAQLASLLNDNSQPAKQVRVMSDVVRPDSDRGDPEFAESGSPHFSDEDSPDALSAGDSSEDERLWRTPLPRARATPRHHLVAMDESSTDCPSSDGRSADDRPMDGRPRGQQVGLRRARSIPRASEEILKALKEEQMWLARKELTGAVARMVCYAQGEKPSEDILSLQRTPNGHLMVMALSPDGPASMAGIVRGDKLVSINGRKTLLQQALSRQSEDKEDVTLIGLRGPVTLIFLGFVGKIQAEVQVAQPDAPSCGLPESADVAGVVPLAPAASVHQHDTVVFRQPEDALIIEKTGEALEQLETRPGVSMMYELQRQEAQSILRQALAPNRAASLGGLSDAEDGSTEAGIASHHHGLRYDPPTLHDADDNTDDASDRGSSGKAGRLSDDPVSPHHPTTHVAMVQMAEKPSNLEALGPRAKAPVF